MGAENKYTGLLTAHALLKKILDSEFLISEGSNTLLIAQCKDIVLAKKEAYEAILQKRMSSEAVIKVKEVILKKELEICSMFQKKLSEMEKIDRIVNIFYAYSAQNIPADTKKLVNDCINVLIISRKILMPNKFNIFTPSLSEVIKKQQKCLDKEDYSGFCKNLEKETEMFSKLFPYFVDIMMTKESYNKSILWKKVNFALREILIYLSAIIIILGVQSLINPVDNSLSATFQNKIMNSSEIIEMYKKNEYLKEREIAERFEKKTGSEILGDYDEYTLANYFGIIEKTWGFDEFKKFGVSRICFIPDSTHPHDDSVFIGGEKNNHTMFIASYYGASADEHNVYLMSLFFHETGHFIRYSKFLRSIEFDVKWKKINGGYISDYAKTNTNEDVAELVQFVMSSVYLSSIDIFDYLYSEKDRDKIIQKILLLKEYGFFPKEVNKIIERGLLQHAVDYVKRDQLRKEHGGF